MRWGYEFPNGVARVRARFAFLPVNIPHDSWVWLERYWVVQVYRHGRWLYECDKSSRLAANATASLINRSLT